MAPAHPGLGGAGRCAEALLPTFRVVCSAWAPPTCSTKP
jgi:hypothetical protein